MVIDSSTLTKVIQLEDLSDLDFALRKRNPARPFDGLLLRAYLDQPEASNEFLRFRERPIDDGAFRARVPDPRTLRAGLQALAREHDTGLDQLFVELRHVGQFLFRWQYPRFGLLVGFDDHHESHG